MRTKAGLRSTAQDRRASHPPLNLDAQVAELVRGARRVAAYAAIGHEPQVTVQPGWLLPVVLPDLDLDWAEYDGTHAVSAKGLHEPVGGRLGVDAIASCDLVLVPALLVDRTGTRLGKGGGCYDRALLRATGLT
ncbi:MAG: 5-formyltetrahydrofolate cyclo-ligase, partial [Frankiales bacterium]|nr:5-formyltetrahydrofolate cyclo-ligase [Frankiales bacterium]